MNAHDVRHLRVCTYCSDLGDRRSMIPMGQKYAHGCCYKAANGLNALLALPDEIIDQLQLDDIGVMAMKELLKKRRPK
jgi:hypothetical protein